MTQTSGNNILPTLYLELSRYGKSGEYDRAQKVCEKILHDFPTEEKALQCKVVSLIQLGNFQEALNVINKNTKHIGDVAFEKAYCLYRLNKINEAWKILGSIPNPPFKVKELKAQVLYRLENYKECYEVYRDVIKNSEDEYEDERETNLAAVIACLTSETKEEAKGAPELRDHTYELCYNRACISLGLSKYADALQKLSRAEELCKTTLEEDDLPEEEIEEELAIVRTQLGYVKQKLGYPEQAVKLYNQVLKQRPSDAAIAAVAANNIVTLNKDQNVFDSKKKMKLALADGLESKLTSRQRRAIVVNQCLLLCHTGQHEQCLKAVAALEHQFQGAADVAALLRAAALYSREKQAAPAAQALQEHLAKHPNASLVVHFTLAQLLLMQGRSKDCCNLLRSLGDVSYEPGVVSALVTLYQSAEDAESTLALFSEAVEWYERNQPRAPELSLLMRESAQFHLAHGEVRAAAATLEQLRRADPHDPRLLAQLVAAYSAFDPDKAKEVSRDLPAPEDLAAELDVDALETAAWTMGARYAKKVAKSDPSPAARTREVVKKKKKKKGKLPKNYNPDVDPDPERWLPRWERSTYKKRKDRRGAPGGVGKGTQGAVGAGSEGDVVQKATPVASPAPQAQPSPQGPRQQKPAQKKKPKKKGRW